MGVAGVAVAHLLQGAREQGFAVEDVGVLGEEAEDQAGHEVVHVPAAFGRGPVRVLAQQLDVQLVQAAGGAHVDGVVLDLLDGGDTGQRQEEAKVIGKVRVLARDGFACGQVFGLERLAVRGEDELGLALGGGRAAAQRNQAGAGGAGLADGDVNVAALEHAAGHVGSVVVAGAQAPERGVLVAEGGQEGEGELGSVEGLERQIRDGLFDFYGVHGRAGAPRARRHRSNRHAGPEKQRLSPWPVHTAPLQVRRARLKPRRRAARPSKPPERR
jgi:hypothetical protein